MATWAVFAEALVRRLVEKLALTRAINDAWMMIAIPVMTAVLGLLFILRPLEGSHRL